MNCNKSLKGPPSFLSYPVF